MFLGPWHEMKKKPKISFIWLFKAYTYSHWLWGADLSKQGATIQKPAGETSRGTSQQVAPGGVARAAPVRPQKRGQGRVAAAVPWSRASRFNARPHMLPLVPPMTYKYPRLARFPERRGFRVVFSHLYSLVVPFFFLLLFFSFVDHVIGKRVIIG